MTKMKNQSIGLIAEDDCDVDSIKVLIHRISGNNRIGIKRFVGKGCGKIIRKCNAWANQLLQKKCSVLILVHDRDRNNVDTLRNKISRALKPCPFPRHLICIPVQEIEAWFLSDAKGIKKAMSLQRTPNIKGDPEKINSPKEYLGNLVYAASNGEKVYLNTKDNERLAENISIPMIRMKCPSFGPFYNFITEFIS